MKKSLTATLAALASLALAAGAYAQLPPPGTDIVGIYTSNFQTDQPYCHYEGVGPQITVYIVYSGLSQSGIAGWEVEVYQEGAGVMLLSATLLGQGPINLFNAPVFQVGLGVPMTEPGPNGTFAVASLLYFYMGPAATTLSVGPMAQFTSWPEDPGPGYADAVDVGILQRCTNYQGLDSGQAFGFNTGPLDPPAAAVDETWGGVKSMFR